MTAAIVLFAFLIPGPAQVKAPPPPCQLDVLTPTALDERATAEFHSAIDRYVVLHRRLERSLPPEQMFDDPEDMFAAREALASALRDARPLARQGDFFTLRVSNMIRARLEDAMARHRYAAADVLAAVDDERLPGMADPEVNQAFGRLGPSLWPSLLAALPSLPVELEYRFWGRDLVLIDLHADFVLDILSDALPAADPPAHH
jgi:hypothetical protein